MLKCLTAVLLLGCGTTVLAGPAYPEIAYVKEVSGPSYEIYLVNPDQSGLAQIYTTTRAIRSLDLKPGGGEIAFVEGEAVVRQRFDTSGIPGFRSLVPTTCPARSVDYHPSDGSLLIAEACANTSTVKKINANGAVQNLLSTSTGVNNARWLPGGFGFVYYKYQYENQIASATVRVAENGSDVLVWTDSTPSRYYWFDVGRGERVALVTDVPSYVSLDLVSGQTSGGSISGADAHFSPDNTRVLYRGPADPVTRLTRLQILNKDATTTFLTQYGKFGVKDWRN